MKGQDVKHWEVYKGREIPDKGDPEKSIRRIGIRTRALREEREQF